MNQYTSHNKICYACGQVQPRRTLGYDVRTLKSYCKQGCPNAENIPPGDLVELTSEDLGWAIDHAYPPEIVDNLERLLGKVVSARPVPALAMHLLKTASANGLKSVNATLQFILERDFAAHEVKEDLQGLKLKKLPPKQTKEQKEIERLKSLLEEQHRQMEEAAPVASPKMQEIIDDVSKKLQAQEGTKEPDFDENPWKEEELKAFLEKMEREKTIKEGLKQFDKDILPVKEEDEFEF